ncbi:protein winged eye isoform X3 [Contarinia nasturtii]|uniref:protein winged eye isoform X3 n=1 Tax=Contarinia nasturtii TaxID=265458 RepID=UPI0012D3B64A|nr:protein winged eye isoform X3 [Contarinia nasturtii]
MYGTSEERRYMGPAGSQTQHHHNSHPHSNSQQATAVPHLAPHPNTPFPSYFSPYSHFQHLAALHTSFGGSNLSTTDLILNQTSALTSSLWPGSPTLSSTTNAHLPHTPSNAASSGRLSAFDFYTNGQVSDSLLAARGFNTPSVNAPYLPVSSLDLVAKNFQAAAAAAQFSQAKSLFLQSQTDLFGSTISTTKKSETCFGRWQTTHQQQHVFEPLHIQVPPITTANSITIKSENISSGSSVSSQHLQKTSTDSRTNNQIDGFSSPYYSPPKSTTTKTTVSTSPSSRLSNGGTPLPITHTTHTATSVASTSSHTKTTNTIHSLHDITSGCSRTIPITWNNSSLLQIKREPCQVSEVTTSNNFPSTATVQLQEQQRKTIATDQAIVKKEIKSPTETSSSTISLSTTASNMEHTNNNSVQSGAIPVGIAVARQRLQEHAQQQQQHQTKDINRFGNIGIATDLGTNSTMIPFSSDVATAAAVSMGVSNVQNTVRTPPTLWQYPAPVPVESMLPHVPFQLLRDPNSGQFLFFPTAATSIDKLLISYPSEPFQQAVVWPTTYTQPQTTIQSTPHLIMPPITAAPSIQQPPPLAPLLFSASDYLSAGTTLHQHTQTHSTRLVAVASNDNTNKRKSSHNPTIPMPIQPAPTLIKIEDSMHSGVPTLAPFEQKSAPIQTATITATQTNDVTPEIATQLGNYYQAHGLHGNLIQLTPHNTSVGATQTLPNNGSNPTIPAAIPLLNTLDCRTLQSQPMPHILTPPDVTISTMSCLTPISETYSRCDDNLDSSGVSSLPEVQDATMQTDTPVMSEDDNTNGADDSAYASNIIVNSNSMTDDMSVAVPTSTSCADLCHSMTNNISDSSSIHSPPQNTSPQSTSCTSDLIHSSTSGMSLSCTISGDSNKSTECSFEMAVSSTNMIEDERSFNQQTPESDVVTSLSNVRPETPQPTDLSINSSATFATSPIQQEKSTPTKSMGPDISGLELLSNSIEAFEKRPFIKQEPIDRSQISPNVYEPPSYSPPRSNAIEETRRASIEQYENRPPIIYEEHIASSQTPQHKTTYVPANDQLGGLNLLCALAEQHFQEEVVSNEHRLERKRSSSSDGSEPKRSKKHKEKHAIKKAKKKERKEKKRNSSDGSNGISSTEDAVEKDFRETFDRIKEKYMKCDCRKSLLNEPCCCKMKFPTPEEVYGAMKSEMRHQLAEIKRKVKEEERKLDAINSKDRFQRESTPSSSKSSSSSSKLSFTSMPTFSPSILSSSTSIECNQSNVVEFPSNGKIYSDTESCSSTSSKRKLPIVCNPIEYQAKKSKSLVGYIFESKKRINDSKFESSPSATDDGSINSDMSASLKRNAAKIKQEIYDFDDLGPHPEVKLFGSFSDENRNKNHLSSAISEGTVKLKPSALSKHNKKIKIGKERKHHQRRVSEHKHRCLVTDETLDGLTDGKKQRVLTAMGGLFYAGYLTAIRPPDLYGVTLDGERGNKAHIMSREDILRDAIIEMAPTSAAEVPPGTRLCAYWSQQYRCLYPGTVAISSSPEYEPDPKFAVVEFDDGDSGRIAIEDIRFLTNDYPVVEYDPNPLQSLGKRNKPKANVELTDPNQPSTSANVFSLCHESNEHPQTREEKEAYKERRRLKKLRKDKLRQLSSTDDPNAKHKHKHKHKCGDELCKHRKHKKRRKHKKHHHRELNAMTNFKESLIEEKSIEDDEQCDVDSGDSHEIPKVIEKSGEPKNIQVAKSTLTKSVNIKLNKIEWPLDEDVVSSLTEDSSGSSYNPGKGKSTSNEKHSKIAAFLPARQLWAWSGKGYKRTTGKGARNKKVFYKSIQRGKETISVGDSAVFLSTGRPDRPYIGQIESLWETNSNNRVVKVKWYYHPEETTGAPDLLYPGALFESPHEDENDVQTISHKCKVLPLNAYTKKYGPDPKQYTSVYDNNDTFYLAGYYDPTILQLKMEKNIPTTATNSKSSTNDQENDENDIDESVTNTSNDG